MMCPFEFEGKSYQAPYADGYIRLPDGRILAVEGWLESIPPQPIIIGVVPESAVSGPVFEAISA